MSTISVSFTETVIRKLNNRKANIHKQIDNTLHENFKQTRGDTICCIFKYQLANAVNTIIPVLYCYLTISYRISANNKLSMLDIEYCKTVK